MMHTAKRFWMLAAAGISLATALSLPLACDTSTVHAPASSADAGINSTRSDTLRTLQAPARPLDAPGGVAVMEAGAGLDARERQRRVVAQILAGNLPDELRTLHPVNIESDNGQAVTIFVTGDYLAVGSSEDFVRSPLSLPSALAVSRAFGMLLPTPGMVDAIYAQADLRLTPQPMPPLPEMTSNAYFVRHQELVEAHRNGRGQGALITGHKKDVVSTLRLREQPGRVAIYGWHRAVGDPIQPLSLVHGEHYADYSHGLRLVHPTGLLDGAPVELLSLFGELRWLSHP